MFSISQIAATKMAHIRLPSLLCTLASGAVVQVPNGTNIIASSREEFNCCMLVGTSRNPCLGDILCGATRAEAYQDLLLLRYCLCSVARALARELATAQPNAFSTHIRRTLFFAFSSWTEEGSIPGASSGETQCST